MDKWLRIQSTYDASLDQSSDPQSPHVCCVGVVSCLSFLPQTKEIGDVLNKI